MRLRIINLPLIAAVLMTACKPVGPSPNEEISEDRATPMDALLGDWKSGTSLYLEVEQGGFTFRDTSVPEEMTGEVQVSDARFCFGPPEGSGGWGELSDDGTLTVYPFTDPDVPIEFTKVTSN